VHARDKRGHDESEIPSIGITRLEATSQRRLSMASIRIVSVGLCPGIDCVYAMKAVLFPRAISEAQASDPNLEVIMEKEIFQDNKARWEVFEWIGSTQSKVIWAVGAAIVVLGIVYLIW
jgi:hypothetical protein